MPQNVLVIDDEQHLCGLFTEILSRDEHRVQTANSGGDGLALFGADDADFGLVFLDMMLPDMTGIDVLREIKKRRPQTPVVMVTGYATKESAVEAMRLGAYDYLSKPFNISDVSLIASRALERNRLIDENHYLRDELKQRYNFDNVVGSSDQIQAAYVLAAKVANQNATVLITGESGTGKEMLARTIHYQSGRADKPFVKVNCAALPEHLLEDELFGHEKGAFTDAHAQRIGRFEWAHTGTLFLDEIGEIPLPIQVKLLRVLQEREFERIGSSKTIKVDVRIIAATNRDLHKAIADGDFRDDLFYRLNVVPIELPPLRERPEDIARLAHHFIDKYCLETGRETLKLDGAALGALQSNPWRGNIRELENCLERAVILAEDDTIEARHLLLSPDGGNMQATQTRAILAGLRGESDAPKIAATPLFGEVLPTLQQAQAALCVAAMERCGDNETEAARVLAISIETLRDLLPKKPSAQNDDALQKRATELAASTRSGGKSAPKKAPAKPRAAKK